MSVFGTVEIIIDYRSKTRWDPSNCEQCNESLIFHGVNYNYRICSMCWRIIEIQLWKFLINKIPETSANIIWNFLEKI